MILSKSIEKLLQKLWKVHLILMTIVLFILAFRWNLKYGALSIFVPIFSCCWQYRVWMHIWHLAELLYYHCSKYQCWYVLICSIAVIRIEWKITFYLFSKTNPNVHALLWQNVFCFYHNKPNCTSCKCMN